MIEFYLTWTKMIIQPKLLIVKLFVKLIVNSVIFTIKYMNRFFLALKGFFG